MARVKLEGHTLGHRHRNYNKIIQESIAHQTGDALADIDFNEDDVNNLIKVDTAGLNRNVDYILGILKGNDMLYVSRAISRCPWLITDNAYAHIINPEYLHSHLFSVMMAKAANKLMLHIRLNLRDEKRVENFFNYYELSDLKTALKWLPHCSVQFMESKVKNYPNNIKPHLLKRLCEKSPRILEVYVKRTKDNGYIRNHLQATMFLLNTHTDFYADLVETRSEYEFPKFNSKCTKILMKACPKRVNKNFCRYASNIHLPTFVKFLNENKVKEFLLTPNRYSSWIDFDNLQLFIQRMPQEERMKFIKDVFINKCFKNKEAVSEDSSDSDTSDEDENSVMMMMRVYKYVKRCRRGEHFAMMRIYKNVTRRGHGAELLHWYKFLPFDAALDEVKEKIKNTTDGAERIVLFEFLIRIAVNKPQHVETLLQYYNNNYLKTSKNFNMLFVKSLIDHTNVFGYDTRCWSLLTNIFNAMNIGTEKPDSSNDKDDEQTCIRVIIIYDVINKNEIPEIISKQFDFDSLTQYQKNINSEKKNLLFDYLYNHLLKEIELQNFQNQLDFENNIKLIKFMLTLLKDWQKNLAEYPYVLNKIKELIKTKESNSLNVSLSCIYDVNKNWRKCLFEESIILCASERVCVNALKHDPGLLSRNENVVSTMLCNDNVALKQLLIKVKVYWPDSLASEWSHANRGKLSQPHGHKALIRGLSFLLPQRELCDIINANKPEDSKINWEESDEVLISLRKHIAKNMHYARPQPTPDDILQYAKGDYLQFALPSLNAILYNLCAARCQELIPRLLNSPVSLQKHGIRLAFAKMQSEDLQRIFSDYWKTTKNLSIRAIIFKLTFDLLCKEKNDAKAANIWGLLKVFIDALTFEEDKTIYERLIQVQKVPLSVRAFYVMRSYKFMKTLLSKSDLDKKKYEQALESFINVINKLVESIEPEFVANILQEYYAAVYTKDETGEFVHRDLMPLMASYIFCPVSEEVQIQRYEKVLLPILKNTTGVWQEKDKRDIVKTNLKHILRILRGKLEYLIIENKVVPVAIYADIQKELENSLSHNGAYLVLTEWKLTVAFIRVLNDNKTTVVRSGYDKGSDYWKAMCMKVAPQFGKMCLQFLKEDITSFFPCIDEYFSNALKAVLVDLSISGSNVETEVLKNMLMEEVTQSYLVAIRVLRPFYRPIKIPELHKVILSHPSLEVKMHYYHKNKDARRVVSICTIIFGFLANVCLQ